MKLKNKQTGEIIDLCEGILRDIGYGEHIVIKPVAALNNQYVYDSLAEFCKEWEDYEEPKGYWYIRDGGNIDYSPKEFSITERHKEIGNYFETEAEAEEAVNKLRAWKRLKDREFKFKGGDDACISYEIDWGKWGGGEADIDFEILFGGEE